MFDEAHHDRTQVHPTLIESWIKDRFSIWKHSAMRSISNQTRKDLVYFLCCNAETKEIIDPIFRKHVSDDRIVLDYSETIESRKRILQIGDNTEEVFLVRLDSDDMYHPEAGERLLNTRNSSGWYAWRRGYGLRYETGHMWRYDCKGVGPFFAHRMPGHIFSTYPVIKECSHAEVHKFNPTIMDHGHFIVGVHGMNTTTHIRNKCFIEKMYKPEKTNVLSEFKLI